MTKYINTAPVEAWQLPNGGFVCRNTETGKEFLLTKKEFERDYRPVEDELRAEVDGLKEALGAILWQLNCCDDSPATSIDKIDKIATAALTGEKE